MTDAKKGSAGSTPSKAKEGDAITTRTLGTGAVPLDDSGPANIAPATIDDADASGAIQEPGALAQVDEDHPAVDNNPRADTTENMNRIDFNEPTGRDKSQSAIVAEKLDMNPEADPDLVPSGPMATRVEDKTSRR